MRMITHISVLILIIFNIITINASHLKDWERHDEAHASETLTFFVALPQRNIPQLEALLYSVSDPKSPEYGRQATQQEIADLVYPTKENHDLVYNFFARPNVEIISYGDSLEITAPVSVLSTIFNAKFYWHYHVPTGHTVVRAPSIAIPSEIEQYIHMITNLVSLPIIMKKQKTEVIADPRVVQDTDFGYFAPSTLRRLYNIPAGQQATHPNSSQCALEFLPEGAFSFTDFQLFCKLSDEAFYNYTNIVGPFVTGEDNSESTLDVQLLATIGSGAKNWFWTISDGWIYEMAVKIFNTKERPWIFSISYGWPEVLTCGDGVVQSKCGSGGNSQYIERANAELAKLGALRISVITCSQDEGAPSEANIECTNTTHPIFGMYPGSSPFVTTVSGTSSVPSKDVFSPIPEPPICDSYPCSNSTLEYSCMSNNTYYGWNTGGGFSEFTVAPSYQAAAVAAYFKSKTPKPPTEYTWPKNRGYPDVSAIGARLLIIQGANVSVSEGTSASTPIFAGIAALLNDARFHAGKSPLGFLNPMLYQMAADKPTTFNDITVGNNKCSEGQTCCEYGYYAGEGWDPVTGLGTPNFGEMLSYISTLP